MKTFTAAVALAAGVSATAHGNVTYVTEVVKDYVTYCPEPTTLSYGSSTYTITSATTFTITDCDCTISYPVYTTSTPEPTTEYPTEYPTEVPEVPTEYPTEVPTTPVVPTYPTLYPSNSTLSTAYPTGAPPVSTTPVVPTTPVETPTEIPTAGAGKAAALSGAGLAGVLGLIAYVL